MAFFRQFPIIKYNTLQDGIINDITDIYRHVDVNDALIDDASSYTYYEIKNGERPDTVSSRLYGTPDYHWTFFVANETLKSGLNSWPLEYNQLREWVNQEYGEYSVMVFSPTQQISDYNGRELIDHRDYFGGLDLSRVKIVDTNSNSARISKFDINSLQLWIHDVDNITFFDQKIFTLQYSELNDEKYEDPITEKLNWIKEIYQWVKKNHPILYHEFLDFTAFDDLNIALDSIQYYELFYTDVFQRITFKPRVIHPKAFNAAKHYIDADRNDDSVISGYQAYNLDYELTDIEIEPYFRGQLQEYLPQYSNFTKGNIIEQKSNTYTNTYTIGEYFIYKDPNPDSVSYLEYEEEKNFEKRKIRVIRKNIIDSFVERYKELVQS